MNYAILEAGGKQYKVTSGMVLDVDRMSMEENKDVVFDKVLLYVQDGKAKTGTPYLDDVLVKARVVQHYKSPKIRVLKFRAKSRYRRTYGSRQFLSKVKIEEIVEKKEQHTKKKGD